MSFIFCTGATSVLHNRANAPSRIGAALHKRGYRTTYVKIDTHMNCDNRNLCLREKGEVHVLEDGNEVDLALGVYERCCDVVLTGSSYLPLGKILQSIISTEQRSSEATTPVDIDSAVAKHVRAHLSRMAALAVQNRAGEDAVPEFVVVDIGDVFNMQGTAAALVAASVLSFIESLGPKGSAVVYFQETDQSADLQINKSALGALQKQKKWDVGCDVVSVLLAGEQGQCFVFKSAAAPHGVSESASVPAYVGSRVFARAAGFIVESLRPAALEAQPGEESSQLAMLECPDKSEAIRRGDVKKCRKVASSEPAEIALVAELPERCNGYLAVEDCLVQAGLQLHAAVRVRHVSLSGLTNSKENIEAVFGGFAAILMPGGFGAQYLAIKLAIIEYARTNNVPYLGICLGFQLGIIEFARNVLNIADATSEEFDPATSSPVVYKLPAIACDNSKRDMYLGAYPTTYSGAGAELYSTAQRKQRYRHRYALRNTYANAIEDRGLRFVGKANYERTVAFKLDHHRFFAGVQYHPELGSTRASVDPIIVEFVSSATAQARNNSNKYVL